MLIKKIKGYLKLLRVHHYLKNVIILLPLVCAHLIADWNAWQVAIPGFFAFCLLSSAIYVINDLKDRNKDKNHPKKCHRPLASGVVSVPEAIVLIVILIAGAAALNFLTHSSYLSWIVLGVYLLLNIGYSFGLKRIPIVDVVILASGYFIRAYYGAIVVDVVISNWMYLTVIMFSFFLGLGKRRNEIKQCSENETRDVLKYYNYTFLDKFMYICLGLAVVFYSLWCVDPQTANDRLIWTIPFVIALAMKYSLDIEKGDSDGDPIEVVMHDYILLAGGALFAVGFMLVLYL
jgi:4-hydroxybenzoate polyprenyltransferase